MYDISLLGENIKKYRRLAGLTQGEIAARLFLSAQNISKWETGKSSPDVENLCRVAEVLGVSTDTLLRADATNTAEKYFIAIDGGGTKTEICLFNEGGKVLERLILEGSNPNACGIDKTCETLRCGIDKLLSISHSAYAIYGGIAGCGLDTNKRSVASFLKKRYPGIKISIDSDIPSIIYSTKKYNDCIAVIMGTGSVVCASKDGRLERFGGYGYLFDDGYSGYTLGRGAVIAALNEEDGIGERTAITKMLQAILGGSVHDKLASLYSCDKDYIARFSRIVFDAYDKNDTVAKRIIADAINVTLAHIKAAKEKHEISGHIVLAGGLTSRRDIFERNVDKYELEFFYPDLPPIYGAAICALRMAGDLSEDFCSNFKESYKKAVKAKKEGGNNA